MTDEESPESLLAGIASDEFLLFALGCCRRARPLLEATGTPAAVRLLHAVMDADWAGGVPADRVSRLREDIRALDELYELDNQVPSMMAARVLTLLEFGPLQDPEEFAESLAHDYIEYTETVHGEFESALDEPGDEEPFFTAEEEAILQTLRIARSGGPFARRLEAVMELSARNGDAVQERVPEFLASYERE